MSIYYVVLIKTMYVFYVIYHNMYYIVSNGEDISKLYILLLFNNNKRCINEKMLFFSVWLISTHIFVLLNDFANAEKKNVGEGKHKRG